MMGYPTVFVIGPNQSGKTTISREIAKILHTKVVEAGGWVRANVPQDPGETEAEHRTRMNQYSKAVLSQNKEAAVHWVMLCAGGIPSWVTGSKPRLVVAGLRNPFDFGQLFDWSRDTVVLLEGENTDQFGEGLAVIHQMIGWAEQNGLLHPERVHRIAPYHTPEGWSNRQKLFCSLERMGVA